VRRTVLAALALAAVTAATAAAARPAPVVSIVSRQPLTVAGAHFAPREWVRVTASSDGLRTLRVRADRRGSFRVTFADAPAVGRCGGLAIRAVGARGAVAGTKLPLSVCLPIASP
jgi:hypothetical protein